MIRRWWFWVSLFLALLGMGFIGESAFAQTTAVTAPSGSIQMGGTAIAQGTAVFIPVDSFGHAIPVSLSGGGLNVPGGSGKKPIGYSCAIVAGAIGSGCNVPDESTASPSGFRYNVTITDTTSFGHPTSGMTYTLTGVPGVTGSGFRLDLYQPTATVPTTAALTYTHGAGGPTGGCAVPALYTDTTGQGLYQCISGGWVAIVGGNGSAFLTGGDVTGASGNLTVAGIRGTQVSTTPPTSGQVLQFDGSHYTPTTPTTGSTGPTVQLSGRVLYDQSSWSTLSQFNQVGSGFSVSSNKIVASGYTAGGTDTLQHYIALNALYEADENLDFDVYATVLAPPSGAWGSGTNYGLAVGEYGAGTLFPTTLIGQLNSAVTPNTLQFLQSTVAGQSTFSTLGPQASAGTIATGDTIHLAYSKRNQYTTFVFDDITQNLHAQYTISTAISNVTSTYALTNASRLAVYVIGGAYRLEHMRVTSRMPYQPDVLCVGDSKCRGYDSQDKNLRWASQLDSLGVVAAYGGGGGTQDILNEMPTILSMKPKTVILSIGRNDIGQGVSTATWKANYASIVSSLSGAGVNIIHMLPIPENTGCGGADQSALTSYINSTYPSGHIIDPAVGWSNSVDLDSDCIHPTPAGHALIAANVLASGLITPATGTPHYDVPPSTAVYTNVSPQLGTVVGGGCTTGCTFGGSTTLDAGSIANANVYLKNSGANRTTNLVLDDSTGAQAASMGYANSSYTDFPLIAGKFFVLGSNKDICLTAWLSDTACGMLLSGSNDGATFSGAVSAPSVLASSVVQVGATGTDVEVHPTFIAGFNGGTLMYALSATSGLFVGPATAPSGSCSSVGWIFSQDGHITFCNGATWQTKI